MARADAYAVLTYAARPAVVAKYLGQLSLVLAALALAPMAVGFAYGETAIAWRYLAVAAALAIFGALAARGAAPAQLQANEALAITALAYLLGVLANAWPMLACGLAPMDALFEAVSGITTTGLSSVATLESMPKTFLFARAWAQWYGGLGIAVLALVLLASYDLAARRLVESGGESLATTTLAHARRVTAVYVALTALGVGVLLLLGMDAFSALGYTFAAISTGGFAPHDAGLGALGQPVLETAVLVVGRGEKWDTTEGRIMPGSRVNTSMSGNEEKSDFRTDCGRKSGKITDKLGINELRSGHKCLSSTRQNDLQVVGYDIDSELLV